MKGCLSACVWVWTLVWACVWSGCARGPTTLEIRYTNPAQYAPGPSVRRLTLVPLVERSSPDGVWAARATARIRTALLAAGKTSGFPAIVAKAVGHDPAPPADAAAARAVGKAAGADAVIHGTIEIVTRTRSGSAKNSSSGGGVRQHVRHECRVNLHCVITDVDTGGTTSLVISEEHPKPAGGPGAATQAAGQPPLKTLIARLVDQCADGLVRRIVSRRVVVAVQLAPGQHRMVGKGNVRAAAGQLDEALECYRLAILKDPRDHGAIFNAGVIHEARGRLGKAAEMYGRAVEIQASNQYVQARRRVRGRKKGNAYPLDSERHHI